MVLLACLGEDSERRPEGVEEWHRKGRDVGALVFGFVVCGGAGNGSSAVGATTVEDVGGLAVAVTVAATGGRAGIDGAGGLDDAGGIVEIAVAVIGGWCRRCFCRNAQPAGCR